MGNSEWEWPIHVVTDEKELSPWIRPFDHFFEDSRRDMILTHPPDGRIAPQLQKF
jgi:hypothetical protein